MTTEDIQFTYEDVLMNTQLNPKPPVWMVQGGKPFKLVVVDPLTFKCVFEQPNGRFLRLLAIENWPDYSQILKPKHYLTQFHIKYTPIDKMRAALDAEKFGDDWTKLFLLKDAFQRNITSRASLGMPVLNPFVLTSIQDETYTYERNPYYYKVDKDGQQLPYLDKLVSPKVQDGEMENMKAIVGEADILRRNAALGKLPLYKENEAKGGYEHSHSRLPPARPDHPEHQPIVRRTDLPRGCQRRSLPPGVVVWHEPSGNHRHRLPAAGQDPQLHPVQVTTRPRQQAAR